MCSIELGDVVLGLNVDRRHRCPQPPIHTYWPISVCWARLSSVVTPSIWTSHRHSSLLDVRRELGVFQPQLSWEGGEFSYMESSTCGIVFFEDAQNFPFPGGL